MMKPGYGEERRHKHEGSLYRIRDVWGDDGRLVRCEYATKTDGGSTVWFPCREGVLFSEIEPFEKAAA
ncbi:hypothetical protein [Sinorhizobium sp. BJ1]|uniref:hypothetical protein n=1 Tax=Sinorhizobium sp. BJ1 TaxID=2035455 RepID=UPI000BEA8A0E|nr:hypothetical protein [Sinorhizobium sp. BJ1]PDT82924.1 hypothetical protein CO676_15225 [Sinorhizobium sp. BJ1]